jgi:site-specific DNA recombinase
MSQEPCLARRGVPAGAPLRAALYARFSSDLQNPRSADDQLREVRAYAERNGWPIAIELKDEAVRAGDAGGRHGFRDALRLAKERRFDVLVVEELSRFSRDVVEAFYELRDLREHGVLLATVRNGLVDLKDTNGLMQAFMGFAMAQAETSNTGARSKRGLTSKVIAHFSGGGVAPYGFRRAPVMSEEKDKDGIAKRLGVRFVPDRAEALVVTRIFQEYAAGLAKHAIAVGLNRDGVPTRLSGQTQAGRKIVGRWSPVTVSAVLSNALHVGELHWNKKSRKGEKARAGRKRQIKNENAEHTVVPNFCERIIDEQLWSLVRARLQRDRAAFGEHTVANANQRRQYLLSGLIICGVCGARYSVGAQRGGAPAYRCPGHAHAGPCTNTTVVSQPGLEARVRHVVESLMKDRAKLGDLVMEHNARVGATNSAVMNAVGVLERRLHQKQSEQERLVDAVRVGGGGIQVLTQALAQGQQDCSNLVQQIEEARTRVQPRLEPQMDLADYEVGNALLLTDDGGVDDTEERGRARTRNKLLLQRVLEAVRVYPDGGIYVQFRTDGLFSPVQGVRFGDVKTKEPTGNILPAASRRALREARLRAELQFRNYAPERDEPEPVGDAQLEVEGMAIDIVVSGNPGPEIWENAETDEPDFFAGLLTPSAESGSYERPQGDSNPC